ncbi:Nucleoside diphosphate kinase [Bifiguratus adelaidae]|uniref:Nucleoside diphosphate kinase n=1 Tax=Bifiguratus adelaidae TaxID=1938954 RepID=A0A261Y0D4_9FUNG|nr:Nucleoside diphosphate kinase [Bifiguratus adelaidae]
MHRSVSALRLLRGAPVAAQVRASCRVSSFSTMPRAGVQPSMVHMTIASVTAVGAFAGYYALKGDMQVVDADTKSVAGVKGTASERTFIAVKPDGVQRGLVGKVISRFEERGYKLVGLKAIVPSKQLAEQHYADLSARPFFKGLVEYMTNGKAPVVCMVWEGKDVVRQGRAMIGATNPLESAPGTIRGQYCVSVGRNIIHGSDSFESAEKEINLWFGKAGELIDWEPATWGWIMADN